MGFEQAWLSYEKREISEQWASIQRISTDWKGRVAEHAAAELQTAFARITGKEPVLCTELPEKEGIGWILLRRKAGMKEGGYHLFDKKREIW